MKKWEFSNLRLFFLFSKVLLKSKFEYRFHAAITSLAVFIREMTGVVVVYFLLQRFQVLGDWNMYELLFLFSLLFLSYSLLVLFFTGIRDFPQLVRSGGFDRFLLRPRGLLYQIITAKADYFASLGHGCVGVLLFLFSADKAGIIWTAVNVLYCLAALAGGVMLQAALFILFACFSFFSVKVLNIREFIFYNTRRIAGYPLSIFPGFIQKLLIFIVPFAFVNYFPAIFLLRKHDLFKEREGYILLAPLVGTVFFLLAVLIWNISLKYYKSTGTVEY